MSEPAFGIASEARRAGLVSALRSRPALTLEQLDYLVRKGEYAGDLAALTLADLARAKLPSLELQPGESVEDAVMRVFEQRQCLWLASGFFVRSLGIRRWTAQKILAELAERGLLERIGRTSGTRYRFVRAAPTKRDGSL